MMMLTLGVALALGDVAGCVARTGADVWHAAGHRGKGVTVAILDSGLKGLPRDAVARSFRRDGRLDAKDSDHGLMCAEVLRHIAPEARVIFANWEPSCPESFLDAVAWARKQGARVISCSMIMPTWSDGEGGGRVHRRLKELLGDEALLVVSAGNTALRHWGGEYSPDRDGWHQWVKGETENRLRPVGKDRVSVELVHPDGAEYEVVVSDAKTGEEVGWARSSGHAAVVRVDPRDGGFVVRVRRVDGKKAGRFHLTVLGGKLAHAVKAGSIPFPGDGPEAVAVSAVGVGLRRMTYSSCGTIGAKPELCAVVPFALEMRPGQPFGGTSAAAPQAAGVAALIWGREPTLTAARVRERMRSAARRLGDGHSAETGWGAVRVPGLAGK
jgi:subtilisin family serine protease